MHACPCPNYQAAQPKLGHRVRSEPRRSTRIKGEKVDYCEVDEHDRIVAIKSRGDREVDNDNDCGEPSGLLDLMGKCARRHAGHTHSICMSVHTLSHTCIACLNTAAQETKACIVCRSTWS